MSEPEVAIRPMLELQRALQAASRTASANATGGAVLCTADGATSCATAPP